MKTRNYTDADLTVVSDNPEWTDAELAAAKPFSEALPELAAAIKRGRGRPRSATPLEPVTLRLPPATIERFKAQGGDWRARMASAIERG